MVNFPQVIDKYATNALRKGTMAHLEDIAKAINDLIDTKSKDDRRNQNCEWTDVSATTVRGPENVV